ncbi:MAG: hypothetical protein Q8O53_00210, partial [Candidatus Moranbacteria bacterium]|nr:hypothetical protein [Candidatus Moranbacteria bacterium]
MKHTNTKKLFRNTSATLASLLLFLYAAGTVEAAVGINKQINFQGKVVNTDGTNVATASYTFLFCIYTTASPTTACTAVADNDAVWRESKSVTVTDGIFQTNLGDTTVLPGAVDFNTDNIYLGINFNANGQMTPLVRFTAAPYALNAAKVGGLTVTDTTGTLTIPSGRTISFADAFTTSGAFATTLTATGITNATLPSGTITLADLTTGQTLTNKIIGSTGLTFTGAATDITTGTGESLVIVANGAGVVDIQDATTVDSLVADTGGVSIAASQSYTGAGAVTLSSAAASDLTINSGTTGTINIGTDASAETINIGNTGAAAKIIAIGNNTQANTITIGDASVTGLSLVENNWSITAAGLITTSGGLTVSVGDIALTDNSGTTWSITNAGVANLGASVTIAGAGDGTDALILTLGDITVTNGDLDVTAGDFNVGLDAADTFNIVKTAGNAGDVANITASSVNAIDGLQLALTSTADAVPDNITGLDLAFTESTDADVWTAINLPNTTSTNSTTQGLIIGTGYDVGISVVSGGISITAGALAVNSDSITSDGTLIINAAGTVDVDDILNANSITSDAGVSIATGNAYTGAGTVTLSSAAASDLTINSGTTGTINIGTDASAETIN